MHSEHVTNLHPGWVLGGWLVSVAIASGAFVALAGLGFAPDGIAGPALALAVGFFAGGTFVGFRWSDAPVLHGVAITLFSVLVWFLGLVVAPGALSGSVRRGDAEVVLGAVLLQLIASVAGGLTGRALVRTGHVPDPASLPPEA
jgi:hypothetical protein